MTASASIPPTPNTGKWTDGQSYMYMYVHCNPYLILLQTLVYKSFVLLSLKHNHHKATLNSYTWITDNIFWSLWGKNPNHQVLSAHTGKDMHIHTHMNTQLYSNTHRHALLEITRTPANNSQSIDHCCMRVCTNNTIRTQHVTRVEHHSAKILQVHLDTERNTVNNC